MISPWLAEHLNRFLFWLYEHASLETYDRVSRWLWDKFGEPGTVVCQGVGCLVPPLF